jgi:hypothetical protein
MQKLLRKTCLGLEELILVNGALMWPPEVPLADFLSWIALADRSMMPVVRAVSAPSNEST